jgi:hypothetical protein
MRISKIFAQGGGYGYGDKGDCSDYGGDSGDRFCPTGFSYSRKGDFYRYNTGYGYYGESRRGGFLDSLFE